jgi:hypothetical protein
VRGPGSDSHPLRPAGASTRAVVLVSCGDTIIFLLFSLAGHSAHNDLSSAIGVIGTALPFVAGWFCAAIALGAYRKDVLPDVSESMQRTTTAWLAGAVIGLTVRSIVERHVVPGAFVAVTVAFNLVLLLGWRAGTAAVLARRAGTV